MIIEKKQRKGDSKDSPFFHGSSGYLRLILAITVLVSFHNIQAQSPKLKLAFYNTENLFDTIDSPVTRDEDFTPLGKYQHTQERYYTKLDHLAKVLNEGAGQAQWDVVGLCEVENKEVLQDLVQRLEASENLSVVHVESPDQRGIDNAFIYNATRLELKEFGVQRIDLGPEERPTRDNIWGLLRDKSSKKEFLVYVNHWPSRYGGKEESEGKRLTASDSLVALIEEHRKAYKKAKVVVMGDLNDHPSDKSVQQLVDCNTGPCLTNTMVHLESEGKGTHAYRGEWGILDHILVDEGLINQRRGWTTSANAGETISFDWMMYTDEKSGNQFPSRTYGGSSYYGGYSDHLPVFIILDQK